MTQLIPPSFGFITSIIAAETIPVSDSFEKFGVSGLLGLLVWWITQRLSKQLDSLNQTIIDLGKSIEKMPCDEVKRLREERDAKK
jgi:hypothetical protein